jgi:hypothetical protein
MTQTERQWEMENLIAAMDKDAWLNSEKRVSAYHPQRVKVLISEETALTDYDENMEDIFADISWEMGIKELSLYA